MADPERPLSDADSRATIARLAADTLPRLIERLTKSDLGELEVREDGWRIRLRRPTAESSEPARTDRHRQPGSQHAGPASDHAPSARRPSQPAPPEVSLGRVRSPGVGYFVARDGVAVGSQLRRGDLVGHVDVLGVMQEIVAPIDGVLRELDVEAGQAIEYGQPLARVEAAV